LGEGGHGVGGGGEERSISRVGRWVGWVTGERPPGELEGKGMRGEGHAEKDDLDLL